MNVFAGWCWRAFETDQFELSSFVEEDGLGVKEKGEIWVGSGVNEGEFLGCLYEGIHEVPEFLVGEGFFVFDSFSEFIS